MIEFKQGVSARLPVRLLDDAGEPVAGVAHDAIAVAVEKADGSTDTFSPTAPDWIEVTAGAFSGEGKYTLVLPASFLDQPGILSYCVATAGAKTYLGVVKIVTNEEADTLAALSVLAQDLDVPYVSFTGGGETVSPIIYTVIAPRRNQVRITFSEAVVMTTDANGALNVSNYLIEGLSVFTVTQESSSQVLLTTSPQVIGQTYKLTVLNIEDLNGNPITTSP